MVSLRATILALASALVVSADYYIDPSTVPLATRQSWCDSEKQVCPLICLQTSSGATVNTCNATTLSYGCLCSDGKQPNVSEYTLTLPYYVCVQWGQNCVAGCNNDNTCQSNCIENHPCGAQDPPRANTTTSSTMSATSTNTASTASNTQIFTGAAGSSATSTAGNSAAVSMLEVSSVYSMMVVVGSLFAGFFLML